MLWSQRYVVLVAALSAVLFSAIIAARSSYDEKDHIYEATDGNYYTRPRQDIVRPLQRPPTILEWIVDGIKSLLQIPNRIRRQGFVALFGQGGLAGLAPVAVAGVATAGVFRNEIAQIIEDIADPTTTTTTAKTTTADPCKSVTCTGTLKKVASLGICQCLECGSDSDCSGSTFYNRCVGGQCVCGDTGGKCTTASGQAKCAKNVATQKDTTTAATATDTDAKCYCATNGCLPATATDGLASKCDTSTGQCKCGTATACTSGSTIPKCFTKAGAAATAESDSVSCKCTGSGTTSDTCSISTNSGYVKTTPLCGTSSTAGASVGVCEKCNLCTAKNDVCASAWTLTGAAKSGAKPTGTAATSTCLAHKTHGCCTKGECKLISETCD